ncbi:MAG: hypothetical protein QNJ38_06145 [Prochloraceae cyanobacterium]|nr:hypothetical protein [Prochloraceae cyanobacterium]
MENGEQKTGYKVGTTAIIWAFGTAMLAICVPLTAITKSGPILPLALIIFGTSLSTRMVWQTANPPDGKLNLINQFQERFVALETRIINLEAVYTDSANSADTWKKEKSKSFNLEN